MLVLSPSKGWIDFPASICHKHCIVALPGSQYLTDSLLIGYLQHVVHTPTLGFPSAMFRSWLLISVAFTVSDNLCNLSFSSLHVLVHAFRYV